MVVNNSDFHIPNDIFLWHTFGDHGDEEEVTTLKQQDPSTGHTATCTINTIIYI